MDIAVTNFIYNTFGNSKFIAVLFKFLTLLGEWWAVCIIVEMLLMFKKTRRAGIYAGITCLVVFCFNDFLLKPLVARVRPLIEYPYLQSVCELAGYPVPTEYSMASGHSAVSMALSASLFMQNKKAGLCTLPYPVLVGISRLVLCVHYLSDVLAGWALGICFAIGLFYLINFLKSLYFKSRGNNYEKNDSSNKKQSQNHWNQGND